MARRLGKSMVDTLLSPSGSPAICGLNEMPSIALKIALICHPPRTDRAIAPDELGKGTSHIPLIARVRGTLKSETPRLSFRSYQGRPLIEFENALPTSVEEPVSMLLLHVNDEWI